MVHYEEQTDIFGKPGAERLAASREAGRGGEILSDSDCEQVAGSMHSSPKKAGGLKKLICGLFFIQWHLASIFFCVSS